LVERVALHDVAGPAESGFDGERAAAARARFRPLVGSLHRLVADVTGPDELLREAAQGLPAGPARAEAVAIRLRRRGVELEWGDPRPVADLARLVRAFGEHGASSVQMARADPSLVPELLLGAWFDAGWRPRLLRRALLAAPFPGLHRGSPAWIAAAVDLAFWRGVRRAATADEWRRLTGSSYVALVYHRLAGELKPGQERIDLPPAAFERQLRILDRLGFRHLHAEELLGFHEDPEGILPRRAYVVTVDDGARDCLRPLERHAAAGPQLFVPTSELGGAAQWLDDEPLLSWEEAAELAAAGVAVGSHARRHRRLSGLPDGELAAELAGARDDLLSRLPASLDVCAYPHGDHDLRVREQTRDAGYRAAFTTERGRNGAGTDPYCLRRVSVHGADRGLAVLWKVATGEGLPRWWLKARGLRGGIRPAQAGREVLWRVFVPALRVRARRRLGRLESGGITVVTVNWQSASYLEVLLRLVHCRSPSDVRILVVDNGSRDQSTDVIAGYPDVRTVRLPFNGGHDLALDIGFLLAETEFVVALDVDAFPLHGRWLDELLEPLRLGYAVSGARLNREYVHPCCLAMRTERFVRRRHTFRSRYRPRSAGRDASGDVGEEISAREPERLFFFDPTSQRGPGDVGTVFGGLVYHNFYSTRFQATTQSILDGRVGADDSAAAWVEALERYGD
jgi:peptidoglycan/xylan/chitin deacetylase (PgdA/CDA1 family)